MGVGHWLGSLLAPVLNSCLSIAPPHRPRCAGWRAKIATTPAPTGACSEGFRLAGGGSTRSCLQDLSRFSGCADPRRHRRLGRWPPGGRWGRPRRGRCPRSELLSSFTLVGFNSHSSQHRQQAQGSDVPLSISKHRILSSLLPAQIGCIIPIWDIISWGVKCFTRTAQGST